MIVRRERWALSGPGKLLAILVLVSVAVVAVRFAYPFLAITRPVQGEFLVAEGWMPVYGMRQAVVLCKTVNYRQVLTSGCIVPDEWGVRSPVTYADWGASKLRRLGMAEDMVTSVPCRDAQEDRTYHSALAVKRWFRGNGISVKSIDVLTLGPHARRSRLLFQKAFGGNVRVGVIAVEVQTYDPKHWWRSSEGVRDVIGEGIAYQYATMFFWMLESSHQD
jgi:uncharacterized SAM-binding protein YcdF (DUF218 family)